MEDGAVRRPVCGTPQGGVISPLLCNVYLTRLDRAWRPASGRLVRYADDLLVVCRNRGQAKPPWPSSPLCLHGLGLEPKPDKTRIVQLVEGQPGFDFLGFHHRLVRSRPRRGAGGFVFSCPLALPTGGAARPGPHPVPYDARPARCTGRTSRRGSQSLPPRLGRVLPVRQLGLGVRQDQVLTPSCGSRCSSLSSTNAADHGDSPRSTGPRSPGPGLPQRHRRRPQAQPGLAGSGRTPPVKDVGEPGAGEPHARFSATPYCVGRRRRTRRCAGISFLQP